METTSLSADTVVDYPAPPVANQFAAVCGVLGVKETLDQRRAGYPRQRDALVKDY